MSEQLHYISWNFNACLILWNHYSPVPMDAENLKKQKESNSKQEL